MRKINKVEAMKFLLFLVMGSLVSLISASSYPSVIVIGAGMSGISAAKTLHDNNIKDFIILEATNRISGRIHKTEFAGYTVEKGANWLHGAEGPEKNPMYEIAEKINLKNFYSDFSNVSLNTYKQNGEKYSMEEVEAAIALADDNEEFGTKLAEQFSANTREDDDMSLLAAQRLNKKEPKTILERMVDFYFNDGEQAEAPRVTSLKHILPRPEFSLYGDGEYFVADPRGFEGITHTIAKSFLSYTNHTVTDPRLMFNQVVTEIEYKRRSVTVKTEDGNVYKAKYVIVSPSLGVLQSDLITFTPELPLWKRRAISEFSIGIYTKIFLKFPYKFWPTGPGTEFFFYVHARRGYYAIWQAPVGRVFFTGEHTHPELFGYADGAYFAGITTANDILARLKGGILPWHNQDMKLMKI